MLTLKKKKFIKKLIKKLIISSVAVGSLVFTPQIYFDKFPLVSIAQAEVKTYNGVGDDFANQIENQDVAKLRARDKAIRAAIEKAGVYLRSYSRSINAILTDDEIVAITSNSYKVIGEVKYENTIHQLSDTATAILWKATVNVTVDDSEVQSWFSRDDSDKTNIIASTKQRIKVSEENDRKIIDIRQRAETEQDKTKLKREFEQVDKEFLLNQKLEEVYNLFYQEKFNEALEKSNEALELNPNYANIYAIRGACYKWLKQYESALADYDKAIELNPNFADAYAGRAGVYDFIQNPLLSLADCNKAIELDPNNATAYNNRGNIYAATKQYDKALADYDKAIELDPYSMWPQNNRFRLLFFTLQRYDLIIERATKSIQTNSNDAIVAMAYLSRSYAYSFLGEYDKSLNDCNKFIELVPNLQGGYHARGNIYANGFKEYDKALADFNRAIEINPDYALLYVDRGRIYDEIKQYDKALADYDKAIELIPNHSSSVFNENFDSMVIATSLPGLYNSRGYLYVKLKEYQKALNDLNKALEISKDSSLSAAIYDSRGCAYYGLKNYKRALADFDKALSLNPTLTESYHNRGLVYLAMGENDKAQADFAKAERLGYTPDMAFNQEYVGIGKNYTYEIENQEVAKLRAKDRAIKIALEQECNLLKDYSKSINENLTDDEIAVIAINCYKLIGDVQYEKTVDKSLGNSAAILWKATVDVEVAEEEVKKWLKFNAVMKNRFITMFKELQKASAENAHKLEDLRKRAETEQDKNKLKKEFEQIDREFLANRKLEEGNALYYNKKRAAISDYTTAIKLNSELAPAYLNRAFVYDDLKEFDKAIADYTKAIQIDPNCADAYSGRGFTYFNSQKFDSSITDFSKSISIDPDSAIAYIGRGAAYTMLQQFEAALSDYNKSVGLMPNYSAGYYGRFLLYYLALHQEKLAIDNFNKAIELSAKENNVEPIYAQYHFYGGLMYIDLQKYGLAITNFSKAIELNPDFAEAYGKRGDSYLNLNHLDKSLADYSKFIKLNPNDAEIYGKRAFIYTQLKQYDKAIKDYTKALKLNPNLASVYISRGMSHYHRQKYNEALADFDKGIQMIPNNATAYLYRSLVYQKLGDNEKAQADFEKAKELNVNMEVFNEILSEM